jgi:flagellar hook-associated protein 2
MATTTFSGLATGIDSGKIIDSLVAVSKIPITQLQTKQSINNRISQKFGSFKTKLAALKTASEALDTRTESLVNKPTSSSEAVVKVTGTGGSAVGKFNVVVTSLAQSPRAYSDGFASTSTPIVSGGGGSSVSVGIASGTTTSINLDASDTLQTLADKINAANVGVTAALIYDGKNYRLQVAGIAPGKDNGLVLSQGAGLSLNFDKNPGPAATDAVFTLDGIPVSSTSNTISNALPGVSLELTGTGTADVSVAHDPDGLKTKIDAFVKAYNDIISAINAESVPVASGATRAPDSLSGDSALRTLQNQLRSAVGRDWSGVSTFGTVGSVGITLGKDGTLSVDSTKLTAAVNKDFEGVAAMFAGASGGAGMMSRLSDLVDSLSGTDGIITTRVNSLTQKNRDIDKTIAGLQTRLDKYQEILSRQFAALEQTSAGITAQGNALINTLSKM